MDDLAGRTALITGANTGIGRATARELARRGARVYIASRSKPKGEEAVADIKAATGNDAVGLLPLDLTDLASVRSCAATFLGLGQPLHILINNAGLAGKRGITRDGFELMFGVNYLGHFALTRAMLECLAASAPSRVINLAGGAHFSAKGVDFVAVRQRTRSLTASREYAMSKLCTVLFSQELARREKDRGVAAYAVHPGVVASDIWRSLPWPVRQLVTMRMPPAEQGARTSVYCATSPDVAEASGGYFEDCRQRQPNAVATEELGRSLWERSEAWTAG
jgi:NAD(P)-dependent dehydrogenase (short-subunit alcohol dehydrogenase family)